MEASIQQNQQLKKKSLLFWIAIGFPVAIVVFIILTGLGVVLGAKGVYNDYRVADVKRQELGAEINNQYKRRADLIPQLVQVVQGEASFEKETLSAVINARSKANSIQLTPEVLNNPDAMKQFTKYQGDLTNALSKLMSLTENYPQLKANQAFRDLHSQIEGTENRVATARNRYIAQVSKQNTGIATFPATIYAGFFNLKEVPQLEFENAERDREAPKVNFNFK